MIPTIVIGGYLGAGKTTLINHLLRQQADGGGQRICVLVNDFGSINIDADLIEARDGDVLSLAGGCLCCSFGADLVGALNLAVSRLPPPEVILIECSGVALPAAAAATARLALGVAVQGSLVLVDASRLHPLSSDRYVGELVRQQWRQADLLLLNQTDRVAAAELAALRGRLNDEAPHVPIVDCMHGAVAPQRVFGLRSIESDAAPPAAWSPNERIQAADTTAADQFTSCTVALPEPLDAVALQRWLGNPALQLQRAKGSCIDATGRSWWLHVMGSRSELTPARRAVRANQLVAIGHRDVFDSERFRAELSQFVATIQP